MAQQYAKAMGLKVIAIDTGDEKRKMCLEQLGSQTFVDFGTSKDVVQDVKDATEDGLGPHAVILVAVNEKPFQQAAEVCTTFQYLAAPIDHLTSTFALEVRWSASVYPPGLT